MTPGAPDTPEGTPDEVAPIGALVTPQGGGAYGFVAPLLASRVEVFTTILIDAALLALSAWVRAAMLWLMSPLLSGADVAWPISVLEWILDIGIVATVLTITVFDLLKRIRNAYRNFAE